MSPSGLLCTHTPNSDWHVRPTDWNTPVGRWLRWHQFHEMKKREEGEDDNALLDQEFKKLPWYRPTSKAAHRKDPALESFIQACTADSLDIKKRRRIKDNLTRGQRDALQSLRNLPVSHGAAYRYVDKSGVTMITDLESDNRKIMQELRDPHHYDILPSDPTESVINRVKAWSKKWTEKGEIDVETQVYIEDIEDSHPGKCTPLVKTHKQKPFPIRLLLSGCGTPIQPLSKFVQLNIGHLTEYLPFQILDTKEFLQKFSEINNTFVPLPDSACFAACDIVALHPNVNNNMGLPAVKSLLKEHPSRLGIRTDCVMEVLDIALTNNTCVYTNILHTKWL